ncbi:MATE family efflux transporter [Acetobacterium woodii]|uniref:Multidrug efflux pump n=1 Tax=Acetobacterium woodii (strain ATCC 29683 / DSM 1030 / JCM 2381 / KCTC 1655 / WB1) TaxID=931626 RepID=H6LHH5_ACEWD|nr:MATE family efflux transporter [Acetobacterium woodii]AFA49685.1 multidrug efflux pump [Acetobacterium woodii DSM 1030]
MNNQFGKDLTTGSIPKNLIKFALPILIGNLLSTAYSIIDTIWVGNMLGKEAVGAVAVSFPIFLGMIALCSGATLATSILISKAYGAKDYDTLQKIVNNSWSMAGVIIFVVITGGLFLSEPMLKLLGTSAEIMPLAKEYLNIIIINFAGLYFSYLLSSILRGIGDTMIPLICTIISTCFNAALDPLLIMGVGPLPRLGLNGAAIATLLSTVVATILGLIYMYRKYKKRPINPTGICFERTTILAIGKLGLPSFIQQMLVSIGYAVTIIFVNRFGDTAIAAFGIANKLDAIVAMPAIAMMMGTAALTAQSIGAGEPERIKTIFKWGIIINVPIILIISTACVFFPETIMSLFVKETDVIQVGIGYLKIVGVGYLTYIVFYVSNGIINGAGQTFFTMIISFISLCLVRIPLAAVLSNISIRGIWYAIVISFAVTMINSLLYYFLGRWRKGIFEQPKLVN